MPETRIDPLESKVKKVKLTHANSEYTDHVGDLIALEFLDAENRPILSSGAFDRNNSSVHEIVLLDDERILGIRA